MKSLYKKLLILASFALLLSGCSTSQSELPYANLNGNFEFTRSDYSILGEATGVGCAQRYWLVNPIGPFALASFAMWQTNESSNTVDLYLVGPTLLERAKKSARTNAVEAFDGKADALIMPLYKETTYSIPPWYFEVCVTLKGKAISLKSDQEITQTDNGVK